MLDHLHRSVSILMCFEVGGNGARDETTWSQSDFIIVPEIYTNWQKMAIWAHNFKVRPGF